VVDSQCLPGGEEAERVQGGDRVQEGENEKEGEAIREEKRGGKEIGAWLLKKKFHLAAWYCDSGWGLRGGAPKIGLKTRDGEE
jgi:hypothetical protein